MGVRLADIAKEARVSVQAASAVVNRAKGTVKVAPETRKRILAIAEKLGYVPHASASALARGKTHRIGIMCQNLRDPHLYQGIARAESLCARAGFGVEVSTIQNRPDWCNLLRRSQIDLLIALGFDTLRRSDLAVPRELRSRIVMIGPERTRPEEYREHPTQWGLQATWDDVEIGRLACQHLLELGHRRIAILEGLRRFGTRRPRAQGAAEACAEAGIEPIVVDCEEEADLPTAGRAMTERLLARGEKVTAIFLRNDLFYPGVATALGRSRLSVPEDVSVVGCLGFYPEVTGVHSPMVQAIEQTLGPYLEAGELPKQNIALRPIFNPGRTCGGAAG